MKYITELYFRCEEIIPDKNVSSNVLLCRYTALYRVDVLTRTTVRCRIRECSHCSRLALTTATIRRGVSHGSRRRALFKSSCCRVCMAVRPGIARLGNEPNSRNLVTGPWSDNQSSRRGRGNRGDEEKAERGAKGTGRGT